MPQKSRFPLEQADYPLISKTGVNFDPEKQSLGSSQNMPRLPPPATGLFVHYLFSVEQSLCWYKLKFH